MMVLFAVSGLIILFALYMGVIRNTQVYNFRMKLVHRIDRSTRERVVSELERVGYDEMVWMFWRSPRSFFDDPLLKDLGI